MKTDAAVLVSLIEEMRGSIPADENAAYKALSVFDQRNGEGFRIIVVVNDCCVRLRAAIGLIPNITDVHKRSFLEAVDAFEKNFSLRNMGLSWKQFLGNISTPVHIQALHFLDFILQSQDYWKSRQIDVEDVTKLLDTLDDFLNQCEIPDFLKSLLRTDIAKLRYILANHEKFGEQDYWDKFQKLTGLFGAIYTSLDDQAREQGQPIIQKMLKRVLGGLSVSADLTQLITAAVPLLPKI